MRLDDTATTIDPKADRPGWHKTLGRQVVALEIQIENAQRAVSFLKHMANLSRNSRPGRSKDGEHLNQSRCEARLPIPKNRWQPPNKTR